MATISVANLIPRCRKLLEDEPFEDAVAVKVSDTSFTMTDTTSWAIGNVLEQPSGGQAKVKTAAGGVLTVKANHNDTTWGTVTVGDVLLKDPRFTYDLISEAITRVVDGDLWPWAWKAVTLAALTPDTTKNWYDLAAPALGLIQVTQLDSTTPVSVMVYGARGSGYPVTFRRNLPTSLVASGVGVAFPNGLYHTTNSIYVTYQALITTSDIEDGLMSDCVVYGACAHLLEFKDVPRTNRDVSEGDATVAPGTEIRTASWFRTRFEKKRAQLKTLLMRQIPPMAGH